jgi:NAD(P)-dependent dehydrogenase (short-subunit alcohol dehydrogenase family)
LTDLYSIKTIIMKSLTGKKVVLLGASSGLGLATAQAAAADGAKVVIVSSNRQRLDQALKTLPEGSEGHTADLSQETSIRDLFGRLGSFDHLVYTAAENPNLSNVIDTDIDQARNFFGIRFWGAFASVKYAAPHINPGGSINLTSGTAGTRPFKGWALASSICGAMEGLVRALSVELAPIRVNSVVPGVVKTNLWSGMPEADRENLYKTVGASLPVGRVGEAEDIALTFLYLMKQTYGTGQNIIIDGGSVLV